MRSLIFFFFGVLILSASSCEKVISVDLEDNDSLLVIEGVINNRTDTQFVRISSSVKVGDASVFPGVRGATVTVTDDHGGFYNFRERAPGIYSARRFRGMERYTYALKVVYNGKEYTAQSKMPSQVTIDSIGFLKTTFFGNERLSLQILYQDPPEIRNYYRFTMDINKIKSKSIFVTSDDFTDGKPVKRELVDPDIDLMTGDSVRVEMQSISLPIYKFWQGLDQNESRGGASVTPGNPISNISNGALGYFSTHTSQIKYTFVPDFD